MGPVAAVAIRMVFPDQLRIALPHRVKVNFLPEPKRRQRPLLLLRETLRRAAIGGSEAGCNRLQRIGKVRPGRCRIGAAKLEQAIARRPALRENANAQTVRDLCTLQEAAIVLQSYKHETACAQVIAALKTLAADPERAIASGDTDESKAEVLDKVKAPKPSAPTGSQATVREAHPGGAKP